MSVNKKRFFKDEHKEIFINKKSLKRLLLMIIHEILDRWVDRSTRHYSKCSIKNEAAKTISSQFIIFFTKKIN